MDQNSKPRWYRRTWVIATVVGLIGVGIGAAGAASDVTTSPEYRSVAEARDAAKSSLATSETAVEDLEAKLTEVEAEFAEVEGDIPAREAAVTKTEKKLAGREAAVAALEKSVRKREKAVGLVEKEIESNTVSGDGLYEVGVDVKAGTYKTKGSSDCYYAVLNSSDTNDIATNNLPSGPAIVSLSSGKFFSTSNCGEWVLQR